MLAIGLEYAFSTFVELKAVSVSLIGLGRALFVMFVSITALVFPLHLKGN
jgi:hypothetical protein